MKALFCIVDPLQYHSTRYLELVLARLGRRRSFQTSLPWESGLFMCFSWIVAESPSDTRIHAAELWCSSALPVNRLYLEAVMGIFYLLCLTTNTESRAGIPQPPSENFNLSGSILHHLFCIDCDLLRRPSNIACSSFHFCTNCICHILLFDSFHCFSGNKMISQHRFDTPDSVSTITVMYTNIFRSGQSITSLAGTHQSAREPHGQHCQHAPTSPLIGCTWPPSPLPRPHPAP